MIGLILDVESGPSTANQIRFIRPPTGFLPTFRVRPKGVYLDKQVLGTDFPEVSCKGFSVGVVQVLGYAYPETFSFSDVKVARPITKNINAGGTRNQIWLGNESFGLVG